MPNWNQMNRLIVRLILTALAVYEAVAIITGGHRVYPWVAEYVGDWNCVAFIVGAYVMHAAFYHRPWMPWPPPPFWGFFVVMVGCAIMVALDIRHIELPVGVTVFLGLVFGHFFWAQESPKQVHAH